MTPAPNKKIIEKINDLEERIEDVITQKCDYYSLWETVDKIMVEIYALKSKADKKENTVVIYGVKLADKSSDEITVDGITITRKLKRIEEKTKALEELETKGLIIIEKTNFPALEDARTRLAANISFSAFQDFVLEFQKMLTKPANLSNPAFRDLRVKFEAMVSSQAFKDSQSRLVGMLLNPAFHEIKNTTILSSPTTQDARERLATILSDALTEVKREIKPHTEPETKKEQNKVEQKPINTEQIINDLEKRIDNVSSEISKIIEKSVNEMFEKKVEQTIKNLIANKEDIGENETEKVEPKTQTKESEFEKYHWHGTVEELIYLIENLYAVGKLRQKNKHKLTSLHYKKRDGTDISANAAASTLQKLKDKYPIIDEVLKNLKNFEDILKS